VLAGWEAGQLTADNRLARALKVAIASLLSVGEEFVVILSVAVRQQRRRLSSNQVLAASINLHGGDARQLAMQLSATPMSTMNTVVGLQLSEAGIEGSVEVFAVELEELATSENVSVFNSVTRGTPNVANDSLTALYSCSFLVPACHGVVLSCCAFLFCTIYAG